MRFAHLLISLPLFIGVGQIAQPVVSAQAEPMNAMQATQLLAKSNAVNLKCKILTPDKSQELRDFVARAELTLAEKSSVAAARKAMSAGRVQGKDTICDAAANKLVNDVLAAANAAVATELADSTKMEEPKVKTPEPVVVAKAETKPVPAKPVKTAAVAPGPDLSQPQVKALVPVKKPVEKKAETVKKQDPKKPAVVVQNTKKILKVKTKSLGTYAVVAERYYMARRCGMGARQINALYKTVLANHKQAMANSRAKDVRIMLKAAEARAGGKSCG